jgi:hypothetical protein
MTTVKKKLRSAKDLSTLDDFLTKEGTREAFQAVAVEEVLAWQIEEEMKTLLVAERTCCPDGHEP